MSCCPACGGKGTVFIPHRYEMTVVPEKAPVYLRGGKDYACPECQPVFHRGDLLEVHAVEKLHLAFQNEQGYMDSFDRRLGARIGFECHKAGLIEFRDERGPGDAWEMRPRGGRLFAVRQDAEGWRRKWEIKL